jgi:hypothetical protein
MGRKDKSSKSVEKKAQRLAMEKKMNERVAIVKAANEVPDPISLLPSFSAFKKNGLELKLETKRVADLDEETKVRRESFSKFFTLGRLQSSLLKALKPLFAPPTPPPDFF